MPCSEPSHWREIELGASNVPHLLKRWTVDDYLKMVEVGILDSSDKVELIFGVIYYKMDHCGLEHPKTYRWTVAQYRQLIKHGILTENQPTELLFGEICRKLDTV